MTNKRSLFVQYGCGLACPISWLNFDASLTLRVQRVPVIGAVFRRVPPAFPRNARYGDIVAGLPVPDGACAAVYCSHVLEHLSLDDLRTALGQTRRMLEPGGTFRLVVPDLEYFVQRYCGDPRDSAAVDLLRDTRLGRETRRRDVGSLLRVLFGNSAHLWMWDYKALANELRQVGFTAIRRATVGDSGIVAFNEVESIERWKNCLGIQATR